MRSLRTALIGLGIAGIVAGAGSLLVVLASDHLDEVQAGGVVFTPLIGWAFIATGLFAWWRRPQNNFGALMTLVGFVWFVAALIASDQPALYAIGGLFGALPYALLLHMLVAFPYGRLQSRAERVLVGVAYFDTTVVQALGILFLRTGAGEDCAGCPSNPILVGDHPGVSDAIFGLQTVIAVIGIAGIAIVLVRRWRGAAAGYRHAIAPVLGTGLATALLLVVSLVGNLTGVPDGAAEEVIDVLGAVAMASVPFAFLVGLLRSRLSRAAAVSDLVARLGEADRREGLRDALATALGDPSLSLAYWVPGLERYVDAAGMPVQLPARSGPTACTPVTHDGRRVAMICHDPELAAESELVEAVGAAAALALENQRLNVELRAQFEELRASRARIVEAADEERRRLERDLHDGAQQRLVSLALNLRVARGKLESDPGAAG